MTADYRLQAIEDPSSVVQDLYGSHSGSNGDFPRLVAEHFNKLFESQASFQRIPALNIQRPPGSHPPRSLVRFRAMIQDTSLSSEMYISRHSDGTCGGWGMYEPENGGTSSAGGVDYSNLQECDVLWATTVPAESEWCAEELDGITRAEGETSSGSGSSSFTRSYKYPHPGVEHVGIQLKIYSKENDSAFKSTDVMTFVGILSSEPCALDNENGTPPDVPTLHVLFTKPHASNNLLRQFPSTPGTNDKDIRKELVSWIANEGLGGDIHAAEWVLLSCIARVQSRHPPLFPPTLVISRFPSPPPVPTTSSSALAPVPSLSSVLSAILPLSHTLPLSLDSLNSNKYAPISKDEDLHAGVLQLPQGTLLLVSEGGVREGQLLEQGIMNIRALQEVMDAQTLGYVFPFSQFSFPTDITSIVLAEGRKSAFFKSELNVTLNTASDPAMVSALYRPREELKMPAPDKLAAFRDLVVGARCGKVQVPEATSEHIQAQFVRERREDRSITADDLIRQMTIAKLYALSLHEPTLSIATWQRAKTFDDERKAAGTP